VLRSYLDGDPPLPEGADGCREAYVAFQRKSRTNYAEAITEAVVERMRLGGFRVGESNEDDDDARKVWTANRLSTWAPDTFSDMVALGIGYMCVQPVAAGRATITYQRPEQTITDHDPSRPDLVRAGLIVYRDDVEGRDFAFLHVPGLVYRYVRSIAPNALVQSQLLSVSGGWVPAEADSAKKAVGYPTGLNTVPIVPFPNRGDRGEFETHTDLLDRLNWNTLQRLVIVAIHAYRQRAIKSSDLPESDEDGDPIDYGKLFEPGPGALWMLPEGAEIWESQQTDLSGILESDKADLRALAAVTRTPMSALVPDGANQSAEGAAFAREGLVFKAEDRCERASIGCAEVVRLALAIERGSEDDVPEVAAYFLPPDRPSMAERYDALTKAGADIPWRSKMTKILQFDGDEVDRMAAERAEDMILTATMGEPGEPVTAPGATDAAAVKAKADAMGVLIRSGVAAESAAQQVGLTGVEFTGAVPVSLRLPESEAGSLEEA
jgi:hypothetical protein